MPEETIQEILLAMQGQLTMNPWEDKVPNIFAEGMPCSKLYEDVYNANCRLCERLGARNEDPDVEIIINSLLEIADIQGTEMFRCGWKFAKESTEA